MGGIHKVLHDEMNEQFYLFIFDDGSKYEMTCGTSLKDAVWEMSKYTGNSSELFRKSLFSNEFGENDVDDIVKLFNHWCFTQLESVYIIKEKIYDKR